MKKTVSKTSSQGTAPSPSLVPAPTTKLLKLTEIRCDANTQTRAALNETVVREYSESMLKGATFPPLDVFFDGSAHILADGFHRHSAANRAGIPAFPCTVHQGTAEDALWFSLGCNAKHGQRRTAADKRRAIEIALTKFPERTQEQLSNHVGCSQQYISMVQRELTRTGELKLPASRRGRDGKFRPTQAGKKRGRSSRKTDTVENQDRASNKSQTGNPSGDLGQVFESLSLLQQRVNAVRNAHPNLVETVVRLLTQLACSLQKPATSDSSVGSAGKIDGVDAPNAHADQPPTQLT